MHQVRHHDEVGDQDLPKVQPEYEATASDSEDKVRVGEIAYQQHGEFVCMCSSVCARIMCVRSRACHATDSCVSYSHILQNGATVTPNLKKSFDSRNDLMTEIAV